MEASRSINPSMRARAACWAGIYFTNNPPQNVSGQISWIKLAVPSTLYPAGFTNLSLTGVLGSPYTNTAGAGVPVLNLTNATLVLSNGNLAGGLLTFTNLNLSKSTLTNLPRGNEFWSDQLPPPVHQHQQRLSDRDLPANRLENQHRPWGGLAKPDQRPGRLPRPHPNRLLYSALNQYMDEATL